MASNTITHVSKFVVVCFLTKVFRFELNGSKGRELVKKVFRFELDGSKGRELVKKKKKKRQMN
jgi:hypothetical protein